MLYEFRLINVRSENNETISFVYCTKSFRSHWNVGAVYIAPKITIAGNMENEKSMGSGTTSEYCKQIYEMFNEIQILKDVTVPRCMKIDIFTELHVFVDASKGSYTGCVFARSIVDSRVSVILVRAKSRLAPLKLLSIPRLELMACCVGARLVNSILKALNMPDLKVTLWSDSTTALWWIKEYGNWSVFVANSSIHKRNCHAGIQIMQSLIRERFWIIRARKTIKSILNECFICARFKVKSLSSGPSPLPPDRVTDCAIFEVVGIDLARPLFLKTGEKELIPLTPAMFLIENRCSDTTDIDELNSRDLRKRMKYRIKLLSDLRQRFRKEYLSELIQKQNDIRVREPRIGEMVLIGNVNKKRLFWPIAKIIELIPGRDGEIRTVRLKTQHGTVIRPVQRIFPLEVQAIANGDKDLKEESISVKSTKPEKVLNTNDAISGSLALVVSDRWQYDKVGFNFPIKPFEQIETGEFLLLRGGYRVYRRSK
ncbi:integrase catalytic domain-containing protein [Trichonephila clavipes]|nr:integrase catalytic domain-containing protein [Trichonephila clavipes]